MIKIYLNLMIKLLGLHLIQVFPHFYHSLLSFIIFIFKIIQLHSYSFILLMMINFLWGCLIYSYCFHILSYPHHFVNFNLPFFLFVIQFNHLIFF